MAYANLQAVLEAHGITASPRQLTEYPLFQFQVEDRGGTRTVKGVVPGIEQVFPVLSAELHPVSVWRWFNSPSTELVNDAASDKPISPRDWLLAGRDPKSVVDLARDL